MPYNAVRPYRFYADFARGVNHLTVIAEQYESDDPPISGTVRLGRTVMRTPWQVRLHAGRARVFVRAENPAAVQLSAHFADIPSPDVHD